MTQQGNNIYLQWDEENRLKGVTKPALGSCYFYDASGERYYKNYGERIFMLVNGSFYMKIPYYQNPVLYTSPYMVVTPNGYTKHYFVENERFASRIGDGNITGLNSHATTNAALVAKQAVVDFYAPDSIPPGQFYNFRTLPAHWSSRHTTYWQHPDHLGSASWVTDTNGRGYQHLQYRAWGEPFVDQHLSNNTYESRYTFSGKERDEETGYSYFGARYYNSALSIWLSVDPMSDKYPSLSPYAYCANNPVKLVDPNGEKVINAYENDYNEKKTDYEAAYNKFISFGGNKNAEGYKEAQREYRKAKREYNDISYKYNTVANAISSVQKYNNTLYEKMNDLRNGDKVVDVYVTIDYSHNHKGWLNIPPFPVPTCPQAMVVKLNPSIGFNEEFIDMGCVLSHEFGHLEYIVPEWTAYQEYLKDVVKFNPNHDGHRNSDPSGIKAMEEAEIYKFNKLKR